MISYCGTEHQKEHWPEHKQFCREIWIMIKEHAVSHLYQNIQGLDLETWNLQRDLLLQELEERLGREVTFHELDVLMFPRICFICHEARQEELKNCPGCPAASFCNEHPSSPLHDADCHKIKKIHEMNMEADPAKRLMLMEVLVPVITHLQMNKSSDLPDSMQEFLDRHAKPGMNFSENEMIIMSDFCDEPLTVFNALKKMNYSHSDIIIHIEGMSSTSQTIDTSKYWEVLFHLLPNLRKMKIVFVDVDSACHIGVTLCQNCRSMNKSISVKTTALSYLEYIKKKEFERPSLVVFFNLEVETMIDNDFLIALQLKLLKCSKLDCTLVFTTDRKREHISLKKILRSSLGNFKNCYEGLNKFGSLLRE
ncbi:uncharacterized protein LOC117173896 [Belonocnema kinseyi]|uniref:uncharacterized protein LOC117173896 n=1 Tax=Belonocnema kinseyi TaxID=2817044 RepID=UPI00143D895C|nr:uncharacterized protein LOC117173896 [Belonocnema kinseyi]